MDDSSCIFLKDDHWNWSKGWSILEDKNVRLSFTDFKKIGAETDKTYLIYQKKLFVYSAPSDFISFRSPSPYISLVCIYGTPLINSTIILFDPSETKIEYVCQLLNRLPSSRRAEGHWWMQEYAEVLPLLSCWVIICPSPVLPRKPETRGRKWDKHILVWAASLTEAQITSMCACVLNVYQIAHNSPIPTSHASHEFYHHACHPAVSCFRSMLFKMSEIFEGYYWSHISSPPRPSVCLTKRGPQLLNSHYFFFVVFMNHHHHHEDLYFCTFFRGFGYVDTG